MIEFLLLFLLLVALEWAGSVREEHELEQELQHIGPDSTSPVPGARASNTRL